MVNATLPDSDESKPVSSDESDALFQRVYGDDVTRGQGEVGDSLAKAEGAAATGATDDPTRSIDNKEKDLNAPPGGWHDGTVPGGNRGEKTSLRVRLRRNRKWLAGIGIGGGVISIPLIILSLLPLKLEMMIQNITGLASQVPEHAIEQRTEYIITRALAARMISKASGEDASLVFCKGGAIACSLLSTYSNDYFKTRLGIDLDVKPHGVIQLGGKASSWEVTVKPGENDIDGIAKTITVKSNGEMKALIRAEVLDKGKDSSILTRFLTRRLLMKEFGVTTWRGPAKVEKALNSLKTAKTNIKTSIIKNTVGKIAPRLTTYLTCLTGDAQVCANLRDSLSTGTPTEKLKDPATDPDLKAERDANTPDYQKKVAAYNEQVNLQGALGEAAPVEEEVAGEAIKGLITKRVLAAVGGVGAALGIADLIFSAVHSASEGAISEIHYDEASQVYTGFATDLETANDKTIAGDSDIDTINAYNSLFDGTAPQNPSGTVSAATSLDESLDSSPLYQAENGQNVDASQGLTVPCNGPNGTKVNTKLAPGELVCADQKPVQDFSSYFDTDPAGIALKSASDAWVNTIGAAFKVVGGALGDILNAVPGFSQVTALIGGGIQPAIDWLMGLVFEPPVAGYEASPADNYQALDAGIRITQNATMEEGVASDGTAMGGGGTVLTDAQVASITDDQKKADQADFNNQPLLARIFDPHLEGSFIQQFVSRIPTSFGSVASLPMTSFMQLFSSASAASTVNLANPQGLPMYGYASDDPILSANPSDYTEASCTASAAARAKSLYRGTGEIVAQYHVADPCALEKMVVGVQLQENGITDDPNSLQPVSALATASTTPPSLNKPANTTPRDNGWTLTPGVDYSSTACAAGTVDKGIYKNPDKGFTVRLCYVNSFPTSSGSDINATLDAVVASVISQNVVDMFTAAKAAGLSLGVSDGMRSPSHDAYTTSSQHTAGLAIDIGSPRGGETICYKKGGWGTQAAAEAACAGNAVFTWLKANAAKYGFQNLKTEPWHWSMGES